ncbi:PREDICTED: arrestin domain-containing protein 3-like [Priapulus caudatus]|uniref:Arrestin domain-containing protein 3-like n=1 Tax=Priapulus caudatus TaxID=37621 RepID=A0ABM1EQ17_PRICU|nr:PREDICTED: arrestin domain-containing protein 3-like [Priapulus caudatus]
MAPKRFEVVVLSPVTGMFASVGQNPVELPRIDAGAVLKGKVVIELEKPLNVKGVVIQILGESSVRWTHVEKRVSGKSVPTQTSTFTNNEVYINSKGQLFKGDDIDGKELEVGTHSFPFLVELPSDLPPNFSDVHGSVTYLCIATIELHLLSDIVTESTFLVRSRDEFLNIDKVPEAQVGAEDGDAEMVCCGCCSSGPVALHMLMKGGAAAGDEIYVDVDIVNDSFRPVTECNMTLSRVSRFRTKGGKVKRSSIDLIEVSLLKEEVHGNQSAALRKPLKIPIDARPSGFLRACTIIEVGYMLEVKALFEGFFGKDIWLFARVPVIVGSPANERVPPALRKNNHDNNNAVDDTGGGNTRAGQKTQFN